MTISRRRLLGGSAAAAGLLAIPAIVRAQNRELVVCGPGSFATPLKNFFISKFEKKFNCTVLFEGSNSLANLQKMRANKGRQIMSVVMMDDPVMVIAQEEGLLEPLTPAIVPNLPRLLPRAILADGAWINYQYPRTAIAFNKTNLPDGVESWAALWEPRFKRRVAIPSLELTQGVWTLIAAAQIATKLPMAEAMRNIEAGFDQLALLKPNLLTIYNQTAQGIQLLEQGEISLIGGEGAHAILSRRDAGAPIDMARPREGSFAMPNGMALVKNATNRELGSAYINEFLSDEFQYLLAEKLHSDPTVPTAPVPAGFVREANINTPDWFYISRNRAAWIDRWARTIGRS